MPEKKTLSDALNADRPKQTRESVAWTAFVDALGVEQKASWHLASWIVNQVGDLAAIFVDDDDDSLTCWYRPGYVFAWRGKSGDV